MGIMKVRLQKFMADCGVASRRRCEELILQGQVRVNDRVPDRLPVLIDPEKDRVQVGEEIVTTLAPEKPVYYLLYKPKGVLATNRDPASRKTVQELMRGVGARVFPVGRLDMDARGLLIMTNDGELAHRLSHPRYGVEKTYVVTVEGKMGTEAIERIKKGMWFGPAPGSRRVVRTRGIKARVLARERHKTLLEAKLTEGKKGEIRRMLARAGFHARDLFRVAVADKITIEGLSPGEFRPMTDQEVDWLRKVSSREYHEARRAATEQWYERKEMQKERRRLERHAPGDGGGNSRPAKSSRP